MRDPELWLPQTATRPFRSRLEVIEIYRTTDSGEEKRQCLSAIGRAKDPALLSEAMDFILDSGEVSYA